MHASFQSCQFHIHASTAALDMSYKLVCEDIDRRDDKSWFLLSWIWRLSSPLQGFLAKQPRNIKSGKFSLHGGFSGSHVLASFDHSTVDTA